MRHRLGSPARERAAGNPAHLAELQDSFQRIAGDDYRMQEPRWSTRFLSERRQARHYEVMRAGRPVFVSKKGYDRTPQRGIKVTVADDAMAPRAVSESPDGDVAWATD